MVVARESLRGLVLELHQLSTQSIVILFRGRTEFHVAVANDSVLVYEEDRAFVYAPELWREAAISFRHGMVVVLKKREGQLVMFGPFKM